MSEVLDAPFAVGAARPTRRLPRGRRKPGSLSSEQVAAHQRLRLYEAMIEIAATQGYAATRMRDLSRAAAVGTRQLYKLFPSKDAYFLATYDHVVQCAAERIVAAYAAEGDWRERLRRAFLEFAAVVVEQPNAARLVLVDVLGMGAGSAEPGHTEHARAVVGRMERTRGEFERMVRGSFSEAPDGVTLPPLVVKGIVCGVERITRQRLLADGIEDLPGLADELLEWALSYRSPSVARLPVPYAPQARRARYEPRARERNQRARILRSAASLAASHGYATLTAGRIIAQADVSLKTFEASFPSIEECFMGALERLGLEALVCAATAAKDAQDRVAGVREGIAALLDRVAEDPVLRRVAFVEVFAVGPAGIERREALLHRFTTLLSESLPAGVQVSEMVVEASVGAIWGLIHHQVVHGAADRLPDLTSEAIYLALAPVLGGEAAVTSILAGSSKAP
jgi:AcrR family transcriptional regulator